MLPTVTIAILARNKAHLLPEFLDCIDRLDYQKDRIRLQVRTNDNADSTTEILEEWLGRAKLHYFDVDYDSSSIDTAGTSNPHDWSTENLSRIAKVRQQSLEKFRAAPTDFYFVVDVDNFIAPYTLKELIRRDEPIVAPMLDVLPLETDFYSNFFTACDANGYFAESPTYNLIRSRHLCGAFEVPVVHCTYLIKRSVIAHELVRYIDGTNRYEFVVFSDSARKSNTKQVIVNDRRYGYLIHHNNPNADGITLEEEALIYEKYCKPYVKDFIDNPYRKRFGDETFYSWYEKDGGGSGPGSSVEYTARFRGFLHAFMKAYDIKTVVDYGCGDWQWAQWVDWGDRTYKGFDIVRPLVDRLNSEHGNDRISFHVVENVSKFEPPDCDLLICKDVLQHLPNDEAQEVIRRFSKHAKHVLWVNDRDPNILANNFDTPVGGYRRMDLSKPPFNVRGQTVFEFGFAPDHKIVFWHPREDNTEFKNINHFIELPEVVVISTAINAGEFAEKCIKSVQAQTYPKLRQIYIANDENTYYLAETARDFDDNIVVKKAVPPKPVLQNMEEAIETLRGDEIVIWLDGDDWFLIDKAVEVVVEKYLTHDPWITWGQFIWPDGTIGFASAYSKDVIERNAYREDDWRGMHLRTFRAGLWKAIPKDRFFMNGQYMPFVTDVGPMIPMYEMAGYHQLFIPNILCVYNTDHSWLGRAKPEEIEKERAIGAYLRTREPLQKLKKRPW